MIIRHLLTSAFQLGTRQGSSGSIPSSASPIRNRIQLLDRQSQSFTTITSHYTPTTTTRRSSSYRGRSISSCCRCRQFLSVFATVLASCLSGSCCCHSFRLRRLLIGRTAAAAPKVPTPSSSSLEPGPTPFATPRPRTAPPLGVARPSSSSSSSSSHHYHRGRSQRVSFFSSTAAATMSLSASAAANGNGDGDGGDTPFDYVSTFDPVPDRYLPGWMLKERTRMLTDGSVMPPETESSSASSASSESCSVVMYWMQRDVRTHDNWALLYAQHLAQHYQVPLHVMHVLPPPPSLNSSSTSSTNSGSDAAPGPLVSLRMTERYGSFLLGGLQCVHDELAAKDVPLHIVFPTSPHHVDVANSIHTQVLSKKKKIRPLVIICDMSPLRHIRQWMESPTLQLLLRQDDDDGDGRRRSTIPLWQVDAHNVVPVWHASPKREVGARTLRPKLHKLVDDCLQEKDYQQHGRIPPFTGNNGWHLKGGGGGSATGTTSGTGGTTTTTTTSATTTMISAFDYDTCVSFLQWDTNVGKVDWATPGTDAAIRKYESFVTTGLPKFDQLRNDPNYGTQICSSLSPWLNFGHVSFATLLRRIKSHNRDSAGKQSFVEEGFVRKELSDNFLWYTPDGYDTLHGAAAGWAFETLQTHASDVRTHLYTLEQLEHGKTHDDLWNASQLQVVQTGKLHGFLRMYWAKKILEWTATPEEALQYAQYLNDYYALDGRDPNGFVGVGWSIMGVHDMGWKEREVFGKIRFMNYKGCQRKFKVAEFVEKFPPASQNAVAAASAASATSATASGGKEKGDSTSISKSTSGGAAKRRSVAAASTSGKKKKKPTKP